MTWPTDFPLPLLSGYGVDTTSAVVRTDMDSGPARVRRRFTSAPDNVTLRYVLSNAQMATFRALWLSDFNLGATWVSLPIRTGREAAVEVKSCRSLDGVFHAAPLSAMHWSVEFKVEVRNA